MDTILEVVDKRKLTATLYIVYLDMSKAFSSINHNIFLQKLKAIWLVPSAVSWLNSYLSQRCQVVCINAALSDALPVVCGVSQSSVLAWNPVIQYLRKQRTSSHWDMLNRVLPWWHKRNSLLYEGCPILRQIYAWHNVFYCIYSTVQKHNKKEQSKTMRNLTMPCINFLEYWTSMSFTEALPG